MCCGWCVRFGAADVLYEQLLLLMYLEIIVSVCCALVLLVVQDCLCQDWVGTITGVHL